LRLVFVHHVEKKERKAKMYDKKAMTKKEWKEKQKQNRVTNGFNTGTRSMKDNKHPSRAKRKENFRKILDSD